MNPDEVKTENSPVVIPAVILGVGLGGFVDGILLHQILQWHHLLSSDPCCSPETLLGLEKNTLADGLFHAGALLAVSLGVILMGHFWLAGRIAPPWRLQAGGVLVGWAIFNLAEGLVNHHLLQVHHVREDAGSVLAWDLGFLLLSLVLLIAGSLLIRSARSRTPETPPRAPAAIEE
jgi:uncharacterized membrane protein